MNHKAYLGLAIPLIISTITTPLLGAVDTAVVGQLPDPAYIGAVAIGTIIFNTMYWLFGFLRVSTSGYAAQAQGANNEVQGMIALTRPSLIAAFVGVCLIILQWPILHGFLPLLSQDADVQTYASNYFGIRIWGAPFALLNYVILGWLMGMSMIKISLLLQVFMNCINITLDLLFVNVFSLGVSGVAAATLIAEVAAFVIGVIIVLKASAFKLKFPPLKEIIDPVSFRKMMSVNRDLFIRTLCLLIVFNLFTGRGASFGTEILAANAILIQIHYIMAYFFDGLSNASSILTGKAIGSNDQQLYHKTIKLSFQWAVFSSMILSGIYYLFGDYFLLFFTKTPIVIELADIYGQWIVLFPLTASLGIVLYGVFTGATEAVPIRNSMILALIVFVIAQFTLVPTLGNHGLWLAFILFSLGRSIFLVMYVPSLKKQLFLKNEFSQNKIEVC